MKRITVLILIGFVLSVLVFADKKNKSTKAEMQKLDTTLVVENQPIATSIRLSITDSLQTCADSLLQQLKKENGLVIPHLDAFMKWLMENDTIGEHQDIMAKFGAKIIGDIKTLRLQTDSVSQQFVIYHESQTVITQVQQVLSSPYHAKNIELEEQRLTALEKHKLPSYMARRVEMLTKGVKYYKNKMAIRRVGDIIDELYELKADSVLNSGDSAQLVVCDSLFNEIIHHQGRNHLIDYVPYAASLRQKVVAAFPYNDSKHVLLEQAHWDVVEAVKKEIESILEK